MIFYHITSEKRAKAILKEGFRLKGRNYIQDNGNGIYLTERWCVPFWLTILEADIYRHEKLCVIEVETEDHLRMLKLDANETTAEVSEDYQKVHDWYFENKHEVDGLIASNRRLRTLNLTYLWHQKSYVENNKSGYIIELYCKKHAFDGVISNKYQTVAGQKKKEYNIVTIYDPQKIKSFAIINTDA